MTTSCRRLDVQSEENARESYDYRTGWGQTHYRRSLAFQYLRLNPSDVQTEPFFRTNLRRIARCINQGTARNEAVQPLEYVCFSEDPDARKVAKVYLTVPTSYRKLLPPEAFCQAAGVSPYRVLDIVTGIAVRFGAQTSAIMAGVMLPDVVQKTIDKAMQEEGTKERALLFRATGLLAPRGYHGS
jgi:hypothetical protein